MGNDKNQPTTEKFPMPTECEDCGEPFVFDEDEDDDEVSFLDIRIPKEEWNERQIKEDDEYLYVCEECSTYWRRIRDEAEE